MGSSSSSVVLPLAVENRKDKVGGSLYTVGESYLVRMVSGIFIVGKFEQETEDSFKMKDCLELMINGMREVQLMFAPLLLLGEDTSRRGVDLELHKSNVFAAPYVPREDIKLQYIETVSGLSLGGKSKKLIMPQ